MEEQKVTIQPLGNIHQAGSRSELESKCEIREEGKEIRYRSVLKTKGWRYVKQKKKEERRRRGRRKFNMAKCRDIKYKNKAFAGS